MSLLYFDFDRASLSFLGARASSIRWIINFPRVFSILWNQKFKMHRATNSFLHSIGDFLNQATLMNANRRFFKITVVGTYVSHEKYINRRAYFSFIKKNILSNENVCVCVCVCEKWVKHKILYRSVIKLDTIIIIHIII